MNIASLMEKLEELVSTGTGVPATGKVLVDKEKMAELVSQIQSALPADLQEAPGVSSDAGEPHQPGSVRGATNQDVLRG